MCAIVVCSDLRIFSKLKVICIPGTVSVNTLTRRDLVRIVKKKLAGEQVLGSDNVVERLKKDTIRSIDK